MELNLTPEELEKINHRIDLEGDDIISGGLLPSDWLIEHAEAVRIAKAEISQERKELVSAER